MLESEGLLGSRPTLAERSLGSWILGPLMARFMAVGRRMMESSDPCPVVVWFRSVVRTLLYRLPAGGVCAPSLSLEELVRSLPERNR